MVGLQWLHFCFFSAAHLLYSKGSCSDASWFPVLCGTGSARMDGWGAFTERVLPHTAWAAPCSSVALSRSLLRVCLKHVCSAEIYFESHSHTWSWSLKWKVVPCPLRCNLWYFLLVTRFLATFHKSLKFQLYQYWWYSVPVRMCLMAGGLATCLRRLITVSKHAFQLGVLTHREPAVSASLQASCPVTS